MMRGELQLWVFRGTFVEGKADSSWLVSAHRPPLGASTSRAKKPTTLSWSGIGTTNLKAVAGLLYLQKGLKENAIRSVMDQPALYVEPDIEAYIYIRPGPRWHVASVPSRTWRFYPTAGVIRSQLIQAEEFNGQ